MNKQEHLLACIGEECGELQQVVGKALRFGASDINPNTAKENLVQLRVEVHDIIAVCEMYVDSLGLSLSQDRQLIDNKKERVLKYMGYAKSKGTLEELSNE